ncbi:hypothetical protein ANN_17060, partial [Periplaneta americana]
YLDFSRWIDTQPNRSHLDKRRHTSVVVPSIFPLLSKEANNENLSAKLTLNIMAVDIGHIRQHICLTWSQATKGNIEGGRFDPVLWIEFGVAQWSERLVLIQAYGSITSGESDKTTRT